MSVFIAPVGLSIQQLLGTIDDGDGWQQLVGRAGELPKWAAESELHHHPQLLDGISPTDPGWAQLFRARDAVRRYREANPGKRLSAELDSLWSGTDHEPPGSDDTVVLMPSDTSLGLLWATLTALVIGGSCSVRVVDGDRPVADTPPLARFATDEDSRPRVLVALVRGLDPQDTPDRFHHETAPRLARAFAWAANQPDDDDEVIVHLTGGFKATLPFLHTFAGFVPLQEGREIRAYCLFEGGSRPVAIPINRSGTNFAADVLRRAAEGEDMGNRYLLEGFAWTGPRSAPSLTSIGWQMLALFDEAEAVHG